MDSQELKKATRHLRKRDPRLRVVIDHIGPLELSPDAANSFATFVQIILGQQLSGKAAATIMGRVKALAKGQRLTASRLSCFTDNQLRGAGVSGPKIRALRSLCGHVLTKRLKIRRLPAMDDEAITDTLTQVKGLGPWSVQMYLMFVLRRPDVFPSGDLGIRNAVAKLYGLDRDSDELERVAEKWRPYRTVACWYLWRSLSNPPPLD
jgi:3-methyladenine DNA glycosylase/8-oxoguanine DNA glycosylase